MWMLLSLKILQNSLKLFSFLYILFFFFFLVFALQLSCFPLPCLPGNWSILHPLFCYWFSLVCFSYYILQFWLVLFLYFFLSLCWSSQWVHSLFLKGSEYLYDHHFELFTRHMLIFFSFSSFSMVFSYSFMVSNCSLCATLYLFLCVR